MFDNCYQSKYFRRSDRVHFSPPEWTAQVAASQANQTQSEEKQSCMKPGFGANRERQPSLGDAVVTSEACHDLGPGSPSQAAARLGCPDLQNSCRQGHLSLKAFRILPWRTNEQAPILWTPWSFLSLLQSLWSCLWACNYPGGILDLKRHQQNCTSWSRESTVVFNQLWSWSWDGAFQP